MPPTAESLDRILPARDPDFLTGPAQQPAAPTPNTPAQRAQPWQAPQQQVPVVEPEVEEEAPVSREEYENMMELIASQGRAPAAPAPAVAPVATPAPAAPNFALRVPTIDPVTISPEDFAKITESPEALSKFMHAQNQAVAARVFEGIGPAVQVAATAAVRSQAAETRAMEQWFKNNPDLEEAPEDAVVAAVREAQAAFPNAAMPAVLFYAARNLRQAMKQNAAMGKPNAQVNPAPARRFAPSGTRPARAGQDTAPKASPQRQALNEMIALQATQGGMVDLNGKIL